MRGEGVIGVSRGEVGRREKGERRREKGEGRGHHSAHFFPKHLFTLPIQGVIMCILIFWIFAAFSTENH